MPVSLHIKNKHCVVKFNPGVKLKVSRDPILPLMVPETLFGPWGPTAECMWRKVCF